MMTLSPMSKCLVETIYTKDLNPITSAELYTVHYRYTPLCVDEQNFLNGSISFP